MPIADGVKGITVTEEAYEALRDWAHHDPSRRTQQDLASTAIRNAASGATDDRFRQALQDKRDRRREGQTKKGKYDASSS